MPGDFLSSTTRVYGELLVTVGNTGVGRPLLDEDCRPLTDNYSKLSLVLRTISRKPVHRIRFRALCANAKRQNETTCRLSYYF